MRIRFTGRGSLSLAMAIELPRFKLMVEKLSFITLERSAIGITDEGCGANPRDALRPGSLCGWAQSLGLSETSARRVFSVGFPADGADAADSRGLFMTQASAGIGSIGSTSGEV